MLLASLGARAGGAESIVPTSGAGAAIPIAHAGADQTVEGGSSVTLNGTSSWDADGDALTFSWTQLEGPAVALDLTDPAHPIFMAPTPGAGGVPAENQVVAFSLTVSDGANVSGASTVRITVLKPFDPVNDAPAVVTNTGCRDPLNTSQFVAGSFGKALQWATTHPGTRVTFRLSASDPNYNAAGGYWQWPSCALPLLRTHAAAALNSNGVTIDGWSQREYGATSGIYVNPDGPAIFYPGTILEVGWWSDPVAPERIVIRGLAQEMYVENVQHLVLSGNYYNMYPDGLRQARSGGAQVGFSSGGTTCARLSVRGGSHIRIGGATPGERNLVGHGCPLDVSPRVFAISGLRIIGNYFGLDRTGTALPIDRNVWMPVSIAGVSPTLAVDVQFGGVEPGSGNAVAGFGTQDAMIIAMGRENNRVVILGNKIGTNAEGTAALANRQGLVLQLTNKTGIGPEWIVGGPEPGAGNLISGNTQYGLHINNQGGAGDLGWRITVQGNRIGTTADGQSPLSNQHGLVANTIGYDVLIGGRGKGEGNLVSGNREHGMSFNGYKAVGNVPKVFGNLIGVAADGTTPLGNGKVGVLTFTGDYAMPIGGVAPGEGNTIAFNGGNGYQIDVCCASTWQRGTVRGNSIHSNGGLGIALRGANTTPLANNAGDAALGGVNNAGRNYPVLTSASTSATGTTVSGTLDTIAGLSVTLDFYANSAADPSGNGEGETYIGSHSFVAGSGATAFTAFVPGVKVAGGQRMSATTTDSSGNTSEFSGTVPISVTNSAPELEPLDDRSDDEGSTVSASTAASDPDEDALTFSATGLPPGIEMDAHSGVMTGTLGYDAAGSYIVSVTVSDGNASDSDTFTWTVVDVNRTPTAVGDSYTAIEDQQLVVPAPNILANDSDPDGHVLTRSITTSPAWGTLSFDADGTMRYMPFADFYGNDSFTYRVFDGAAYSDPVTVQLVTNPVNDPPTLTPPPAQENDEADIVNLQILGADIDSAPLTYGAEGLPGGLSIDSATGLITGTLAAGSSGSHTITVTVRDSLGAEATGSFAWTVDAPTAALNCSTAVATVQEIWPPNHRQVTVGITGLIGTSNLTIRIDRVLQDEPTQTVGDGNSLVDGGGIGASQAWVRAERSGTPSVPGNGRMYEILFTARDEGGASCSGTVFTGVRHDQKRAVIEDPVRYDSATGARVR